VRHRGDTGLWFVAAAVVLLSMLFLKLVIITVERAAIPTYNEDLIR